jgi:Fe-S cluster assembly iron-binding protein IscA
MVQVTDRARQQLRAIRDSVTERPEVCLRFRSNEKGRFGLYPDTPREGDQVVEHDGTPVLVLGRDMAAAMAGRTIDFEEIEGRARWTLRG